MLLTVVNVVAKKRIRMRKQLNESQKALDSFRKNENFCRKAGRESNSDDKATARLEAMAMLPKLKAITIGNDLEDKV